MAYSTWSIWKRLKTGGLATVKKKCDYFLTGKLKEESQDNPYGTHTSVWHSECVIKDWWFLRIASAKKLNPTDVYYVHCGIPFKYICLTNSLGVKAIFIDVTEHFLQECTQVQKHIFAVLWQLHDNLKQRTILVA